MAPTMTVPSTRFPPPTYTNIPFFGLSDSWSGSDISSTSEGTTSSFLKSIEKDGSPLPSSHPASPSLGMERSIRKVLAKYGAADLHGAALLPSYRSIRRRRPQEENQAVAVTQDETSYKIMIDVREFAEGTLTVRALGDDELVVEGVMQTKEESSPSEGSRSVHSSSRNFQQRFVFPGLQVEGVTSTVSSDGVLTVTAPRRSSEDKVCGSSKTQSSVQQSQSSKSTVQQTQSSTMQQSSITNQEKSQESLRSQQSSLTDKVQSPSAVSVPVQLPSSVTSNTTAVQNVSVKSSGEHIVPIEVEGQLLINKDGDVQKNYTGHSLETTQQKVSKESTQTSSVREQSQQDSLQKSQQQDNNATQVFKQADTRQLTSQDQVATSNNSVRNIPINTSGIGSNCGTHQLSNFINDSLVPIDTKGLFFQDSFFENSRRHFQEATNKIMRRVSGDSLSNSNPIDWYTNHRASNLVEDTRAGTITTEEKDYKIVLDVRDFAAGSVAVRAMGDSEILVEGKMEKKTEGTSISRSFRRRFVMPGLIKCEAITSALSADGVLTITAPKNNTFQIVELKGDENKSCLHDSSVFVSQTPSCASPSVSIPVSSLASPTSDISGPFDAVFSKTGTDENTSSLSQSSTVSNLSKTTNESTETLVDQQSRLQASIDECLRESNKILNNQNNFTKKIDLNTNEKIVDINYVDKSQTEIDNQNRLQRTEQEERDRQFLLIGSVKDLTDSSLKEDVKQRKSVTSVSQGRDIAIKYDNPTGLSFPIVRRGPFYQDSIFNEVHSNFQSAIRQVLDRWVDVPSLLFGNTNTRSRCNMDRFHNTLSNYSSILDRDIFDDFTCYKSLRHRNLKEESQAATVRENPSDYKIVLDVHGFSEKDITIRATSHNELIIEGKIEEKSSGSHSSHSFKKQFILPGPVRMDAVYSALSADDVLTITVPRNTALSITNKA